VLGLYAAVCLWVVWRTGPGKVRALDLAEATARGWPTVAVPTDSQYILWQPLGQLLYRLLPVHGTNIRYAPACPRFDGGRVRVGAVVRSAGTYQGERGKLGEIMRLTARLDPTQHRDLARVLHLHRPQRPTGEAGSVWRNVSQSARSPRMTCRDDHDLTARCHPSVSPA